MEEIELEKQKILKLKKINEENKKLIIEATTKNDDFENDTMDSDGGDLPPGIFLVLIRHLS